MSPPDSGNRDVIVIGAGPNGLLAAERLEALGHRVRLLEAGPLLAPAAPAPPVDSSGWAYRSNPGLKGWLRTHAVGGKSLGWGGYMFPFPQAVFTDGQWPYSAATLAPGYREAAAWIGCERGHSSRRQRQAAKRLGWPLQTLTGARRDGIIVTGRDLAAAARAETGQLVAHLSCSADAVRAIQVHDLNNGGERSLSARAVILACSPLESARLLLDAGIKARCPSLGTGLVDHPTVGFTLVERLSCEAETGPELLSGAMIPRFVNLGPGSERSYFGGFSIEVVGPLPLSGFPAEFVEAVCPEGADPRRCRITSINAMGETSPQQPSHVRLCPRIRDGFGRPQLYVHHPCQATNAALLRDMRDACLRFADAIAAPGSDLIAHQDAGTHRLLFHEAGVCRMGVDDSSPCDPFGRLRALDNVWIADAGAFPSAGDRHPTLTLLAHTLRVVHSVDAQLRR